MSKQIFFRRIVSLLILCALAISFFPMTTYAQETTSKMSFSIDGTSYYVDMKFEGDLLYCRADQWAEAAGCLFTFNPDVDRVLFHDNTPVILANYGQQEYIKDGDILWVPFFDAANQTGVYFSKVSDNKIYGYRATPLAVFYKDMDRMFAVSKYRITELILGLDEAWLLASSASRSYAILSSFSIKGFLDALSGKMEQDMYDAVFLDILKTDETLLGALTNLGDALDRPGKIIHSLQKSLDEDGALVKLLKRMDFGESDIRQIVWDLSQGAYGNKLLNDLADLYEFNQTTHFLDLLKFMDDMTASMEADSHTVLAMEKVFSNSGNAQIRNAVKKAIGLRTENKKIKAGAFIEHLEEILWDDAMEKLDDILPETTDVNTLKEIGAKAFVWVFDKALSLTDTTDAIMYSDVYSQIQLELVNYYYKHRNDASSDNGLLMHSVAMLYLRSCLASWKMFDFDNSLSQSISNATSTIKAEITNLMKYTEEELLQNGTGDETAQAITDLVFHKCNGSIEDFINIEDLVTINKAVCTCNWNAEEWFFEIPQINLYSAEMDIINETIMSDYSELFHDCATSDSYYPPYWVVTSEYAMSGDILSLVIEGQFADCDGSNYDIYNISLSNQTQVDDKTVIAAAGWTESEYRTHVKQALGSEFWNFFDYQRALGSADYPLERWIEWDEMLQNTICAENVDVARPFLGENGDLWIVGDVYIPAGSGIMTVSVNLNDYEMSPNYAESLDYEKPEELMCIEVSWDDEDSDGELLNIFFSGVMDDGSQVLIGDWSITYNEDGQPVAYATPDWSKRSIEYHLFCLDGLLKFEVSVGQNSPDFIGLILDSGAKAVVTYPDGRSFVYTLDEGVYKSYTGAWFWAPFSIDHGALVEYDASWIDIG